MDNTEKKPRTTVPRVEKILLQMTQRGDDWAGKATCFIGPAEFHFNCLEDLFEWFRRRADQP